MGDQPANSSPSRSTFVTVLAWIFIVCAGFATFISVIQNIMIGTMMSFAHAPAPTGPGTETMPAFFRFMFEHVQVFFLSFLVVSFATLVASIGLLRRKNWARLAFVGILGLGIVWNLGALVLQQVMFSSMGDLQPNVPTDAHAEFDRMATIMFIFSLVMALGFSALFAWLIKRLLSPLVRAEFQRAS